MEGYFLEGGKEGERVRRLFLEDGEKGKGFRILF